jgi:hypothetical protein
MSNNNYLYCIKKINNNITNLEEYIENYMQQAAHKYNFNNDKYAVIITYDDYIILIKYDLYKLSELLIDIFDDKDNENNNIDNEKIKMIDFRNMIGDKLIIKLLIKSNLIIILDFMCDNINNNEIYNYPIPLKKDDNINDYISNYNKNYLDTYFNYKYISIIIKISMFLNIPKLTQLFALKIAFKFTNDINNNAISLIKDIL